MKIIVDDEARTVSVEGDGPTRVHPLYSAESFRLLSRWWVKVGWNQKYPYGFSWFGRPVIQLPEDMIRLQEVIYQVQPDVLIETGVAHGGSLVFYASLFEAMGRGRVIGVDIEIRPHNRAAIEGHALGHRIALLEGSSTDSAIVARVRELVRPSETALVVLDSNHTKSHVSAELEAYAPLVTSGSYIVATDGIMLDLHDVPRGRPEWRDDNPTAAASEFAAAHREFVLETPARPFDESDSTPTVTYWPGAYLRRR